ncbi:hypothetical protein LRS10_22125 [Phenylobacterium sp. J426]|uniref:hypothetical protein n=1 Tax=Phenylobacterium sp. J426 TaxID=2898439 RepID=UPI002150D23F|nr:hypothetical protein [Phenylobacterium sp. J426]MCR5876608.1 hypothetical protein [Phenylobacterium sp. J426]
MTQLVDRAPGLGPADLPSFLLAGGEMAARIRDHDWSSTPLGPLASWPQALKTLVGVMMGSNQPMFIAWGPDRTLLYNTAYAHILASKHPDALGRDFLDVWSEIRADLTPHRRPGLRRRAGAHGRHPALDAPPRICGGDPLRVLLYPGPGPWR